VKIGNRQGGARLGSNCAGGLEIKQAMFKGSEYSKPGVGNNKTDLFFSVRQ
jgi:hypothetical protein